MESGAGDAHGEVERGPEGLRLRFDSPSEFATELKYREFNFFFGI
jgi:hypothetical protein